MVRAVRIVGFIMSYLMSPEASEWLRWTTTNSGMSFVQSSVGVIGKQNMILVKVFGRAFLIVTCTALNVTQVAQHRFLAAFFTGGLLSYIWWTNSRTAAHSEVKHAQIAYALGAAFGTVFGMFLGGLLG